MSQTRCKPSPSWRHQPHYDNGAIVLTDDTGRHAVCQWCKLNIRRAHRRSAWWHKDYTPGAPAPEKAEL